jgi:predicted amidohydrolase YtcJ
MILYATLAKGPKLPLEQQVNSTRQFMRELNRLGLTSAIDAGGGFQNYPEDYEVIAELHEKKQMTIRIAYNLFTQRPGHELEDFEKWTDMLTPGQGSDFFHNGAGEMLVFSAADFEDFSNRARTSRRAWRTSWSAWCAIWWSTAGRSACTPPITNPSAACWTCSRR